VAASRTSHVGELLRILVVDDSQSFRYVVRSLLAKLPMIEIVGEAADGSAAIEMSLQLVPDVITMDVKMPRLNGMEATRHIKRALQNVQVVGISSLDDEVIQAGMINAGCAAFITKDCAQTLPDVIVTITGRSITRDYPLEAPVDSKRT
jgi:DNA-binding NarL/FixJ family response regulator